jgi:hypothetical protein
VSSKTIQPRGAIDSATSSISAASFDLTHRLPVSS